MLHVFSIHFHTIQKTLQLFILNTVKMTSKCTGLYSKSEACLPRPERTRTMVKYGVRSPKFIWAPCAELYSLAETPQPLPPSPAYGLIYEGAIGQPR